MASGHEVHAYMNQDCRNTRRVAAAGVSVHTYQNANGCILEHSTFMERYKDLFLEQYPIQQLLALKRLSEYIDSEVEAPFLQKDVLFKLAAYRFNLFIIDTLFFTDSIHVLAYKLDIPVIPFIHIFNPRKAGVPGLPSFTPDINLSGLTNEMTFVERVKNTLIVTVLESFFSTFYSFKGDNLVSRLAPEMPFLTINELLRRSKLWLVVTNVAIDYPQVRMPHVVDVGGMNTAPARELSPEIGDIADRATNGLIIVAFGTFVSSFMEKTKINQKLFEAFKQLNQTIFWSFRGSIRETVPPHIHVMEWIPQNDLLAHPNTKLFITHCGANSQFEALYHSVPMLGLPIADEQIYYSRRMAKHGLGIHISTRSFEPEELVYAVNELLTNETYKNKMAVHSAIFKDRPMTPMETLVYWVEHVMKYGSDHLVSPAIHLPWYVYWCVDVIGFLITTSVLLVYLTSLVIRHIFSYLCRSRMQKIKR